jgi:large repetitive protein
MKKSLEEFRNQKKRALSSSMRLVLENRLLFDGAVIATAAQVADDKAGQDQYSSNNHDNQSDATTNDSGYSALNSDVTEHFFSFPALEQQPAAITQVMTAGIQGAPNLLIVDPRAEGVSQLLQSPPANTDIRVLNPNRDGYQQINEILQDRDSTSNLDIQTAGLNGSIWFGSSKTNQTIAASDSHILMDWGNELAANAKITFHSDQAQTANSWLAHIQALTGGQVSWVRNDALHSSNDDQIRIDQAPVTRAVDHAPAELVFVDTAVKGYKALLKDIDPAATVILLDPSRNGVEQIAEIVSKYDNVEALHIISHGSEGELKIGNGVLNQANMQSEYADELATIGQHLSQNADILIYGCDFGKGDSGLRTTHLLAALTSADIADSTNPTGSANLGGDWILERSTGIIESGQVLSAAGMAAFEGILAPTPTVTLSGNSDVAVGSDFTFTATFDNTVDTGYAPFIDLVVPATGKDGAGSQVDDGVSFVSATYLGQPVTATTITFNASGQATHPIAKDSSGAFLVINASTYGLQAGDQLVVLQLPFGSVTAAQPSIPVVITARLSDLADVAADTSKNLTISARAGFRFGSDALDNPTTDPSVLQSTAQTFTVQPTVVTMTQTFDGPENDTATGPNYVRHLTTTTTPATGQTLTNFDVTQTLPDTVVVKAITPDSGGTVTSITLRNGTTITNAGTISSTLAAGTFLQSYTVRYATLSAAKDTVVDFYVPENNFAGNPILNANTGDDETITILPVTGSGSWDPTDSRDAITPVSMSSNDGVAIEFEAKSIAVQKSVSLQNVTGASGASPGDKLEYTLKIDVSDYFAFGKDSGSTGSWLVNDVLGDGQTWDSSFIPTLTYTDTTGSHSVTLANSGLNQNFTVGDSAGDNSGNKAADGKTYLQFDLVEALTRLQGDLHGDPNLNGASSVTINLRSTIDDNYTTSYSHSVLNEGDSVTNNVTIDATLINPGPGFTLTGNNETDGSAETTTITANQVITSIVGVNGNLGAPSTLKPGDNVTIRVRYDLATGDYENFELKSFLPLPVLLANDSNADGTTGDTWSPGGNWNGTGGNMPTVGEWKYGDSHTAGNVVAVNPVTADGVANSLTFDFGSNTNPGNDTKTAEVLFTIRVDDAVFTDELLLTLLAQSLQNDTVTSTTSNTEALVNIELAEPEVIIKTGVVQKSHSGTITGTTGTWKATADTTTVPFTGIITSANAVDGNLTSFDGGDTIRLATALENTGGSEAFDVTTTIGAPPAGLTLVGGTLAGANLKVALGNGTLLVAGTDYSISGNTITFLDNGGATLGVGRNGSTPVTDGTNVVVITYDVTATNTVNASQNFTTDATLTNYASTDTGPDFTTSDLTDSATEIAAAPSVVKVFQGGTITNDDSNSSSTTGANVVVGESMVYDIKVTLPEGNTQNLRLDDLVPVGMKLDTSFNGTGYELITTSATSGGSLSADFNGAVSVVGSLAATPSGTLGNDSVDGRLTFSATSSNTADNNTGNDTFVVRVRLIAGDVIGNQAVTNLSTPAQLVYSDTDGNGTGPATDSTVANTGGTPVVTVREPTLTINKIVSPTTPIDDGDTVQYTITIANPSGGNNVSGYDLIYGDTFPNELSGITLVSATKAALNDVFAAFEVSGNTVQTLGGTAGNAGVNLDLAPGETITLVVSGVANSTVAAVPSFDSNSVVRWSSIDSTNNLPASQDANERTGVDGVGSGLDNYAAQDGAPVTVQSVASLTHIGGLPDTPAPTPDTTNPENVAIGEIVRYRAVVRIPEGSIADYNIQATLSSGLSYINDGTTKVGFVYDSAGGSLASSVGGALITSGTLQIIGNETALEAGNIPADLLNGPEAVLAGSQINTTIAQAPVFNLGTLANNENDNGSEYVVIEFNARVDNTVANTTADSFNVNFTARTGTTVLTTSNTVVENVVEPTITNLTKTVTAFDPALISDPNNGRATMTLNFTNSGDGAANNVNLTDSVTGGSNYSITSVIIGGTSYTLGTLPSGVTASTTSGISVDFSQLAAGTAVSVVYTVDAPNNAAIASTDAVVTYSGLPETFSTFAGSSVGSDGSSSGERDSSGGASAPNNYRDVDGAGLGIINGTLWDDTNNANGVIDVGETLLAGQQVTLVWAGANGVIGTGGDDLTFTTTTDASGNYHFGALPAGNYRITGPNGGGTITVSGDTLSPRFDTDGGTLGQVTNAVGEGATATANIGYVQQNDAPVNTVPGLQTVNEDGILSFVSGTNGISIADPDASTSTMTTQLSVLHGVLNVTLTGGAAISAGANGSGTLTLSGSQAAINATLVSLTYSPVADYHGSDTLTVLTNDRGNTGDADNDGIPSETVQDALTDSDTVAINITSLTDIQPDNDTTPEDTPITLDVLANDGFTDPTAEITAINGTAITDGGSAVVVTNGSVQLVGGELVFTPAPDFHGTVPTFTYTVLAGGVTETADVDIIVTPLADIVDDSDTTLENTPVTLDVLANDGFEPGAVITAINGTAITEGGPAVAVLNGSVQLVGGELVFTPALDFNGTVPTFTYTVLNAFGDTETANVDITVVSVSDIVPDSGITPEDTPITLDVLANDGFTDPTAEITAINGTAITDGGPAVVVTNGSVQLVGGELVFTPAPDFHGTVPTFTYTVLAGGVTETADVDITVTPVPDIVPDSGITPEDTPITLDVLANDAFTDPGAIITAINGQPITDGGSAVTLPNGSVQLVGGKLVFTPDPDFNGTVPTFTYTVTSGSVTETANVDIAVTPVNDPPVAIDDGIVKTVPDQPAKGNVLSNDMDPDNDTLKVTQFTVAGLPGVFLAGSTANIPSVGTLVINENGNFTFTPKSGYEGPVPIVTYVITDGIATDTATLSFSDVPESINNIGSVIMLANPTPSFPPPSLGGSLALLEDNDLQPPIDRSEIYSFSRQSLYGNLQDCNLYLTISLRNQVVLEMQAYSFSVPPETFCHCNPHETLEYVATKPDGTPLPNWLHFNPKQLIFSGVPPKGSMNTVVMLTAKDRYGNEAHSTFTVTVNKERDYSSTGHHKWVVKRGQQPHRPDKISQNESSDFTKSGKLGFNEQVLNSGKISRLVESRALLNALEKMS